MESTSVIASRQLWGGVPEVGDVEEVPGGIYQMVLASLLPHKIVNLLCTITYCTNKLAILWEG